MLVLVPRLVQLERVRVGLIGNRRLGVHINFATVSDLVQLLR
jgi:hypothetical protein